MQLHLGCLYHNYFTVQHKEAALHGAHTSPAAKTTSKR